jgi:LysR family hydrogen peroxide-inducible transcriptional activator
LSEQIKKLEARLGADLLNRNHRRIVPTAAGRILAGRAEHILATVESAAQEIRSVGRHHAGTVTIGILPTVAPFLAAQVLQPLFKPGAKIQAALHEAPKSQILERIEVGALDFGIVSLPVREHGFETEDLFFEELLLALRPKNPLCHKREITLADIRVEKFILLEDVYHFGRPDFHPRIKIHSGQLATVQALVAAGMGMSLIPQMAAVKSDTNIIYRSLVNPAPTRTIAIVTRSKRDQTPVVQEFLKHLRIAGAAFARTPLLK